MSQPYIYFHRYSFDEAEKQAILATLESGWITRGPRTAEFENALSAYTGCPYALALNSCTAGLHLALLGYNIGPGDEVITTPLTFVATANVIMHAGARPVFVDIEPDTLNIDPAAIRQAITPRTRAILPVHYAGHPCDMETISAISREHGIPVIEDAAHAIGAEYQGQKIGALGDVTVFSFYATKNITTGEGGMLLTRHKEIFDRLKPLSLHGLSLDAWARYSAAGYQHYLVHEPGYKYNMTDLQAALGLAQLPKCDGFMAQRAEQVAYYQQRLQGTPFRFLDKRPEVRHAHHLCVIQLELERLKASRDDLIQFLHTRGIGSAVHFIPVYAHPYYSQLFPGLAHRLPVAARAADRLLSLPLYPGLKCESMDYIIETLCQFAESYGA